MLSFGSYPKSSVTDCVEDLHGYQIADPYRWLEDANSAQTKEWVASQRDFTESALAQLPDRQWFTEYLSGEIFRPIAQAPWSDGGWYFRYFSDGKADQPVLQVAASLEQLLTQPRVLLDPNTMAELAGSSVGGLKVSGDSRTALYTFNEAGSDWQHIRLIDLHTAEKIEDEPVVTKFCVPAWLPDGKSYLYLSYPDSGKVTGTETKALSAPRLCRHYVGTSLSEDEVVLDLNQLSDTERTGESAANLGIDAAVSADGNWVLATLYQGTEIETKVWAFPIGKSQSETGETLTIGEPVKLVDQFSDSYEIMDVSAGELFSLTSRDAENGQIVAIDLNCAAGQQRVVVPESKYPIESAHLAGDTLILEYLVDAKPAFFRFSVAGEDLGQLAIDGGARIQINATAKSSQLFISTCDITNPMLVWQVEARTGQVIKLDCGTGEIEPVKFVEYRKYGTSADGTKVPYWLFVPENADLSKPIPVLLYGYGGFWVAMQPSYSSAWAAWLAGGGAVAIANLRGGSEFGTSWYQGGILANKQHVFDDFISVAEDLIATGVTDSTKLVIHGRSNGGLLVGACLTQRPDLYAAALPMVGVLDLLRFHKFTIGAAWCSDYGNPDVSEQFEWVYRYSPLHNVKDGVVYPPTLICTGDHDDRVVPAHSYKFAARLQSAQQQSVEAAQISSSEKPVLIRISANTGHGAGKPKSELVNEWADMLAFAAHFSGLKPQN